MIQSIAVNSIKTVAEAKHIVKTIVLWKNVNIFHLQGTAGQEKLYSAQEKWMPMMSNIKTLVVIGISLLIEKSRLRSSLVSVSIRCRVKDVRQSLYM